MITTGRNEAPAEHYDKIYIRSQEYNQHWSKSRYVKLRKAIIDRLPQEGKQFYNILDCGCGTGQMVNMLNHYGYKAKGIDFSKKAIEIALKSSEADSEKFEVRNIFEPVYGYDTVLFCEVLEHIQEDVKLLQMWSEVSTTERIIITVPSFDDPSHVRYFKSIQQVSDRYIFLFRDYHIEKIGSWFIVDGIVKKSKT